ncbi:MAG: glycosyltransferase family 2 protein [Methanolobus sp.]|uniref:glycosyltransferase family 2 protein n=1 Tax=Methanolobus sp. TaxID=1874737 RepID=UPI00272F5473|nr:glycosyltransferase family 2 protein [Methanolobus sp.]MDP2218007.1 glycosyltransferase family 2 protein [Methanolobus sp.]
MASEIEDSSNTMNDYRVDYAVEPDNCGYGRVIAAMPAFNEEKYIAKTVLGCKPYVDEVVVVNDGSEDATAMIATACGATVIYHDVNLGYGAAINTCFETARKIQARAMVIIDSDGQHDPSEIARVLHPILKGEADVSIGSRFMEGHKVKIPLYRKVGMKVLDTATNQGSGVKLTDTQSGFRAYSNAAINEIMIGNSGMSAGSEILMQIKDHNLKVKEVPITCRYDIEDTSTHNPVVHGVKVLSSIITDIEYKRPLVYIGVPGLLLLFAGLATSWFVLYSYNNGGSVPFGPAILMVLLFTMGLLAVFSALTLHAMARMVNKCTKNNRI